MANHSLDDRSRLERLQAVCEERAWPIPWLLLQIVLPVATLWVIPMLALVFSNTFHGELLHGGSILLCACILVGCLHDLHVAEGITKRLGHATTLETSGDALSIYRIITSLLLLVLVVAAVLLIDFHPPSKTRPDMASILVAISYTSLAMLIGAFAFRVQMVVLETLLQELKECIEVNREGFK